MPDFKKMMVEQHGYVKQDGYPCILPKKKKAPVFQSSRTQVIEQNSVVGKCCTCGSPIFFGESQCSVCAEYDALEQEQGALAELRECETVEDIIDFLEGYLFNE